MWDNEETAGNQIWENSPQVNYDTETGGTILRP